jgi:hypothetical protein
MPKSPASEATVSVEQFCATGTAVDGRAFLAIQTNESAAGAAITHAEQLHALTSIICHGGGESLMRSAESIQESFVMLLTRLANEVMVLTKLAYEVTKAENAGGGSDD